MCDIDQIMDMINWNNTEETQQKGIKLARNIKNLDVFIMSGHPKYKSGTWENCAKILSERTDEELEPYLSKLLKWLEDLNWSGSLDILDRLNAMNKIDMLIISVVECVRELIKTKKYWLIGNLAMLLENDKLLENLPADVLDTLKYFYWNY